MFPLLSEVTPYSRPTASADKPIQSHRSPAHPPTNPFPGRNSVPAWSRCGTPISGAGLSPATAEKPDDDRPDFKPEATDIEAVDFAALRSPAVDRRHLFGAVIAGGR